MSKLFLMGRGNKSIDNSIVKTLFEGNILIPLPKLLVENHFHSLFSLISPTHCDFCGAKLNVNSHYTRSLLTSYGTLNCSTTYWICPNCKKYFHDQIVGVSGSANYSDEFYDKQIVVRYDGRCSLHNSCRIGETYTEGLTDICGRAPCASSLWLYEQKQAAISRQELSDQNTDFDETLYVDGDWIKKGWKKKFETLIGRELTIKEWKKMRYQYVYVIATKEKVILDFEITDRLPTIEALLPFFIRTKNRFPEGKIQKIISDEDKAIIGAVKSVFPEVAHSFCVFHQLKNVSKRYIEEFRSTKNIPENDELVYNEICQLIRSDTVVSAVVCFQKIRELDYNLELSEASRKAISYAEEIFKKNVSFLKKGFTPETDNTMEQVFSLISDIVDKARSFKTDSGLTNFCYNLFTYFNKQCFRTGKGRGFSPLMRARFQYG
ncbi:transposase [Methanosarcina sp. Z-7115]|uniref:Transposase n=1 Tax=Methanosarcina baikalica TaxID=3073890 RepID=A0ABU2D1G0_9EURY|nr:transposase [Methanosarcina sp. Z-7115]MDR7665812.1 transposase [Methanosarcina sp. Z-7115]